MEKRCSNCKEPIEPVSRTVCIKCLGTSFDYSYVDEGYETKEESESRWDLEAYTKKRRNSEKGFTVHLLWRVLGTLGAASFLLTSIRVLSDPNCISADFGGGRVSTVTCRPDSFGSLPGGLAGFLSLLAGSTLIFFIYKREISNLIYRRTNSKNESKNLIHRFKKEADPLPSWWNVSLSNPEGLPQIKICDGCEKIVPLDYLKCFFCNSKSFSFKNISSSKNDPLVSLAAPSPTIKVCPFCAEEVKSAAIKCKHCGSDI
jgi:hypothetical protein